MVRLRAGRMLHMREPGGICLGGGPESWLKALILPRRCHQRHNHYHRHHQCHHEHHHHQGDQLPHLHFQDGRYSTPHSCHFVLVEAPGHREHADEDIGQSASVIKRQKSDAKHGSRAERSAQHDAAGGSASMRPPRAQRQRQAGNEPIRREQKRHLLEHHGGGGGGGGAPDVASVKQRDGEHAGENS